jgi:hypothetical protein
MATPDTHDCVDGESGFMMYDCHNGNTVATGNSDTETPLDDDDDDAM